MNESDSLCPVCGIRFVLGCVCVKMNHPTTENKIGWGNPEYDVRIAFSEVTGVICTARKCRKSKYQRKK